MGFARRLAEQTTLTEGGTGFVFVLMLAHAYARRETGTVWPARRADRTLSTSDTVDSSVSIRAATISCTLVGLADALSVVFRAARDFGYFSFI